MGDAMNWQPYLLILWGFVLFSIYVTTFSPMAQCLTEDRYVTIACYEAGVF